MEAREHEESPMTLSISALRRAQLAQLRASLIAGLFLALAGTALAAGPLEKAKDAVDPDCTVGKAAKGAATKAVVGVRGNRCDAGETMRDTIGIDDRDHGKKDDDGPLKKLRKN
jgi:hypothetical protein